MGGWIAGSYAGVDSYAASIAEQPCENIENNQSATGRGKSGD
jgi:hypothetical protein